MEVITPFNKKPSEQWKQLAEKTVDSGKSFKDNIEELRQLSIKEGLSPQTARTELNNIMVRKGIPYSTFIRQLPAEFKATRRPKLLVKKDPLVKEWRIDVDLLRLKKALDELIAEDYKKGYITHDNRRVVDVYGNK